MHCGLRLVSVVAALGLLLSGSGCAAGTGAGPANAGLCEGSGDSSPAIDPTNRDLAFTSNRSGNYDLWLMEVDGSDPVRLTTSKNADVMPSWSPDGTRLVYASAVDQEHNGDICVINADGTGLRNLTNTPDVSEYVPSWSPDGTQIVYVRWEGSDNRIHIMDSDGETHRELTSNGLWPSWSADGEQIVFVSDRNSSGTELWTMSRDGSNQQVLTETDGEPTEPSWSPDGEAIAFILASGDPEASDPVKWNEDVFVMPADGGPATQITNLQGNDHWPPAWSPDSERLAFTADGKENAGKIVIVEIDSLAMTTLTDGDAQDMFPAWRH